MLRLRAATDAIGAAKFYVTLTLLFLAALVVLEGGSPLVLVPAFFLVALLVRRAFRAAFRPVRQWQHVVLVFDGERTTFYADGEQVASEER